MATIVLVHAAWQGEWVQTAASADFSMHGHEVLTIELPKSGMLRWRTLLLDCTRRKSMKPFSWHPPLYI